MSELDAVGHRRCEFWKNAQVIRIGLQIDVVILGIVGKVRLSYSVPLIDWDDSRGGPIRSD